MTTEAHEHAKTEKALDEITGWARALAAGESPDGGENITFAIARQGSHTILNAFLTEGDCTPFVPSGKRGVLHNQPPPQPPPIGFFITPTHTVQQVPLTMKVDLNTGTVTLQGAFPEIDPRLDFRMEFLKRFDDAGSKCILFYSDKSSDKAGYLITFGLVGAS